jgi:hypothetical protein
MSSGTASCIGSRPGSSVRWRRKGGEPRNSASSRRVSFSKLWWRFFAAGSASGSCVGAGGSPFHSGAGRRAGLGAGRRMMLGSITRSFRPPTITRCSILSRRTRMTLRFPSTGRDSITATRAGALRRRSLPHSECRSGKQFGDVWQTCRCRRCSHEAVWVLRRLYANQSS